MTEPNINSKIIEQFELLVNQVKLDIDFSSGFIQTKNMYRLAAIQKVLKILEKYPEKITLAKQLAGIKNVGKKSLARIDEIIKTGKLAEIKIDKDAQSYLKIISELEDVYGIGRKKAYELFKKHSIMSLEDLQQKFKENKIELPDNIIKGLKYVGKIQEKIPREQIEKANEKLQSIARQIDPLLFGLTCGSYRREKATSGDIDFILIHTELITKDDVKNYKINLLNKFVTKLKQSKIIIESLTGDDVPTKYMGISKLENGDLCRIDIRFIAYESFYPAILYFTGSKDLNKKMRQVAINLGYTLNEYGLFDKNGNSFKVKSEKDIFELLGMEYLSPSQR